MCFNNDSISAKHLIILISALSINHFYSDISFEYQSFYTDISYEYSSFIPISVLGINHFNTDICFKY